jgi:phage baseplate assembly protein V
MDFNTDNAFPSTKVGRDHQMRDMFRHGKVIDRKHDKKKGPLVRIQYLDKQGLISKWIPVKQTGARSTMHYYCPKIGDDVNVTMLPNGSENGFVDGSFFNEGNPPPEDIDIDTRQFKSADGTVIEYQEKSSSFSIDASGATNGVGGKSAGGGTITVKGGQIELSAPTILITGNIQHTGLINTSGIHTDANGIHMGGMMAEVADLKARMATLEAKLK